MDVMQLLGSDTTNVKTDYLWMDDNGIPHGLAGSAHAVDYSAGYHTFTLEWMPDYVAFYVDGDLVNTYRGDFVLRDPAYILLNLAVGGDTAGSPNASTSFPQSFDIDYLRVWQKPL
jgi:beta-glucanase (GH16 family)